MEMNLKIISAGFPEECVLTKDGSSRTVGYSVVLNEAWGCEQVQVASVFAPNIKRFGPSRNGWRRRIYAQCGHQNIENNELPQPK